jgi:hypothetical protein
MVWAGQKIMLLMLLGLSLLLISCEAPLTFEGERVFRLVIEVSGTVADPGGNLEIEIIPPGSFENPEGTPWAVVPPTAIANLVDFQQEYTALVAYKNPEEFLRFSLDYIFDTPGQSISARITYEELTPGPWSSARVLFDYSDSIHAPSTDRTGSTSKSLLLPPE